MQKWNGPTLKMRRRNSRWDFEVRTCNKRKRFRNTPPWNRNIKKPNQNECIEEECKEKLAVCLCNKTKSVPCTSHLTLLPPFFCSQHKKDSSTRAPSHHHHVLLLSSFNFSSLSLSLSSLPITKSSFNSCLSCFIP